MVVYLSQCSSMAMKKGPEMKVLWINNIVSNFLSSHRWHKKNKIVLNPIVACADVFWLYLMSNVKIFFHSLVYYLQVLYYTIDKDPWQCGTICDRFWETYQFDPSRSRTRADWFECGQCRAADFFLRPPPLIASNFKALWSTDFIFTT